MRSRVRADRGGAPRVVFLNVLAILRDAWSLLVAGRRWLTWRRRRFVVRRRGLIVCGILVLTVAGFEWAQPLQAWLGGTVLAGRARAGAGGRSSARDVGLGARGVGAAAAGGAGWRLGGLRLPRSRGRVNACGLTS